ncbi:hypothetical protein F4803DRAFT_529105 [Xylaria telfairii]|nr:hypothetical protein F4803DRAFT_529105 [Xylaria telfairii]
MYGIPVFMRCRHPGNRWRPYPVMAPAQQQQVVIDLTQDDSDDGDKSDHHVPGPLISTPPRPLRPTPPCEPPAEPKTVSPASQSEVLSGVSNPPRASATLPGEYIEILEAFTAVYNSDKNLDPGRDIELSDIHDRKLRNLTTELYEVVSKDLPSVTVKSCRDALTGADGWRLAHAIISVIGISNDNKVGSCSSEPSQTKQTAESLSTNPTPTSPHDRQESLTNDPDDPFEVFRSFLTIQRTDFVSGKDFLRACEKLRVKLIDKWNLRLTQSFTHTLFINAMRSHDPFLAEVLRRVEFTRRLEFQDLKHIIRKSEMTDDTRVGNRSWGEWKAELSYMLEEYKGEDSGIE